ncbi:hypothetical protein EsVE80_18070 [Enterococcus saigonensis]|uniref:Uncharacterized protein n=1 Tax=Enterococcus saigonensis TaxID=1805431 RepID=A0A679IQN5_9ENTE|nr:hypothetical protein [Enterococcus saigonensis]BCA86284.1 hypothetical protein EsVE80_18070 [Enterococcus saigonensis]
MEIIYPPLVEEYFKYQQGKRNFLLEKSKVYKDMVVTGLITETGMPTEKALESGMIKDFYEEKNLSFADFLVLYPIFTNYDPTLFQQIDGFWEITLDFKNELLQTLADDKLDYDEALQLQMYLEER